LRVGGEVWYGPLFTHRYRVLGVELLEVDSEGVEDVFERLRVGGKRLDDVREPAEALAAGRHDLDVEPAGFAGAFKFGLEMDLCSRTERPPTARSF
jgi:hypothetical protein